MRAVFLSICVLPMALMLAACDNKPDPRTGATVTPAVLNPLPSATAQELDMAQAPGSPELAPPVTPLQPEDRSDQDPTTDDRGELERSPPDTGDAARRKADLEKCRKLAPEARAECEARVRAGEPPTRSEPESYGEIL